MQAGDATTYAHLVEFEERAASLYLNFARRFKDNKDLSLFWLQMSMEERQHALLLEFCGCEQLVAVGLPDSKRVQTLAKVLSNLEERAGRKHLSVDDAFLIAGELEGSEISDVYAGVIKPIQGTSYVMRKKVAALKPDHMQALLKAAHKFGVSADVVSKMVEVLS